MQELENALNSNSPIVVAQIFSRIIENIKEKHKTGIKDSSELTFLKDKCIVPDPLINEVAGAAIIKLVKEGILPMENTLADFITSIPLTKCYKSLLNIIGNLLYLEMKTKIDTDEKYINNYNLWLPQHPYITILNENANVWNCVLNEMKFIGADEKSEYATEFFRPIYLYALCNPNPTDANLKQNIWHFILSKDNLDRRIFFSIFGLLQIETKNNVEISSNLLSEALSRVTLGYEPIYNLELLILWQTSFLYHLAINKSDLRQCISCLKEILEDIEGLVTVNCLLLILAKTITVCSSVYLLDLLNLCENLLVHPRKDIFVLETLKASLLHWLASPSILTTEANKVANGIFTFIENNKVMPAKDESFKHFASEHKRLIATNKTAFTTVEMCLLLSDFTEENIVHWIELVEQSPSCLITDLYSFLCGLFVSRKLEPKIAIKVFSVLLKFVDINKMMSTQLLTLILYKLSNTTDSRLHFALLKALPKMIVLRENIPKVMAALQALSKSSADLFNFSLSLTFDAWKVDNKCYSYLESMLIHQGFSEKKWDTYVTKSFILKELCERKPELYGKEIVAHLSKILNECNDDAGSLPCSIAIDGIRLLCKSEVIDIVTTWATLSPKFKNDTRTPVIKSLCSLLHEIPNLPYTESYVELQEEAVRTLWEYVETGNPEVTEAALNGLTSFSLEQICSQLPEKYLDENAVQERKRTVLGVPQMVPGNTWVKFLIENQASKEAVDFIIKMISTEVAGYLKYVYQVKGHREPINYDYLPTHSIVRGIGEFIKTWANKWKHSIHDLLYIECLRIFSEEYSKPLPPLDWCFLQELLHDTRIKDYCIDIASHQAILSGTARRLMENYIEAVTQNLEEDDIMNVVRNLKHLANSIQPVILKPFFENAIVFSTNKFESGRKDLLRNILKFTRVVLQNAEIQETNKTTIAQVLTDRITIVDIKSELFNVLLECVIVLPKKCIDEITALKSNVSEDWLEKITKIRCSIASNTNISPLTELNDIIEISSTMKRNDFVLEQFVKVFRKHINNPSECALWLLELIGQIQAKVAERSDAKEILYFFDVFILTVTEFSGHSAFIKCEDFNDARRKELFPQAFNTLLSMNDWSVCINQALEWLFHMNTEETVPSEYRNLFGLTLWCLRHDEEFIKNVRWMKYLSSKVAIDIS